MVQKPACSIHFLFANGDQVANYLTGYLAVCVCRNRLLVAIRSQFPVGEKTTEFASDQEMLALCPARYFFLVGWGQPEFS